VELQQFDTKPLIKVRVCKMHCISWLGVGSECSTTSNHSHTYIHTHTDRRPGSAKLCQTPKYNDKLKKVELQQFDTKPLIKVRVCKMHCISWLGVGVCHSLHTCTYTCVCTTTHNTYRRPGSAKLHQTSKYTHLYPKSRIATIRHQTTDKS